MRTFFDMFAMDYVHKLGARAVTFRALFDLLEGRGPKCIVETGCARTEENWTGDGQSTRVFSHYAVENHCDFWSVDNDPGAITTAYKSARRNTILVLSDSVRFLFRLNTPIDVLYLDSYDLDKANPAPAAQHCLLEATVASRLLTPGALVMIDDTWREKGVVKGKGYMVADYMRAAGAELISEGYQDLWRMPS